MGKFDAITDKLKDAREEVDSRIDKTGSPWDRIKSVIGVIVMVCYRLRKAVLAAPVVYYALKLASYNNENLPDMVGINLQSNGVFTDFISRNLAVMGPLGVTAAALVMMFFSKKAMYPWAVSVFTLALPVLLLLSNQYPA